MKKLFLAVLLFAASGSWSQTYMVTPAGLRDNGAADQSYLVISVDGKTASQLHENAMKYVNVTYQSPEYAIKGNVAGEYLKLETYVPDFLIVEHMGAKYDFNVSYTTELSFKDGRVKFEFLDIRMTTDSGTKLLFTQEMTGVDIAVYNKKLELKKPELKTDLENYFNRQVSALSDYLFERSASDKW